jgi:predicted permease
LPEAAAGVKQNTPVLQILFVTFPFFALVLAGYVAARRAMLPLEAVAGLNSYVLFFALPCMLYRFGSTTPLAQLLDPAVFVLYLLVAFTVVGVTVASSLNARIGWNDAAFGALVAAFPNTGFMGVPLLVALLGPRAAGPSILAVALDMIFTSSLCIALSRLHAGHQHNGSGPAMRVALRNAIQGVAMNPLPWAIVLGALSSALRLELAGPLRATVGLLADSASPVALFTIGAVLARSQMLAQRGRHAPVLLRDYVPIALIKLLLHPLLMWGVGTLAIRLGLPLDHFTLTVLVLLAALPSASNVSLLAERFGADNGRIARIILVSTTLAFFTFSAAVAWLRIDA